MERIFETNLSIEFKNLPQGQMEFYKNCFAKMIDIKDKVIIPGQIIINIDENCVIGSIDIRGRVYKKKKGLDNTL